MFNGNLIDTLIPMSDRWFIKKKIEEKKNAS